LELARSRRIRTNITCDQAFFPLHSFPGVVSREGGHDLRLQLGWTANLGQDPEEALSADKVEHLREMDESDIQGHLLFPALLLKLAKGEDHVYR